MREGRVEMRDGLEVSRIIEVEDDIGERRVFHTAERMPTADENSPSFGSGTRTRMQRAQSSRFA